MISVHLERGAVQVRRRPKPRRPPGFALVRVLRAGICNTDLELQRGYYGFVGTPGHEFVGEVIEADSGEWRGRRVVGDINLACGRCEWCARSLARHCPHRTVLGIVKHPGAFAGFLTLPEGNLHTVPDTITTEQAVFVEPLAAACEILEQLHIEPGLEAAVLGDGKLGLLVAQVLKAVRVRVKLFGRHPGKLAIAERAGVAVEKVKEHLPKAHFPLVVDATGSANGLRQAIQMTAPRGTVVMKSTVHGTTRLDTAPVVVNEITLLGSRCGRFAPAIELLKAGKVKVDDLISEEFPLADAPDAFRKAAGRGVLKVLLRP